MSLAMLHKHLINPKSIVVIGGSDNLSSPGGRVLKNLIDYNYKGGLYVVNPKKEEVQNIKTFKDVNDLPKVDLAIIAIAAKFVEETVKVLTQEKDVRGFIIFSAGFSETSQEGANLEARITKLITDVGGSLLGPNNIGLVNANYAGVFTTPIPKLDKKGVDLISGSGATAVFIIEASKSFGLTFSSVYTLGNSAQIGVEEVLEYLDKTFDDSSSKTKMLYIESIKKPKKFLQHAKSLVQKGCKITAIKAGSSEAGSRAASSHTGALATSDVFVDNLLKKAGVIRCYSKNELIHVASILQQQELKGSKIAIVTHAGGPAVMLTDVLTKNGLEIPLIPEYYQKEILKELFNGSSAVNPIDFLATGTTEQLDYILSYCEDKLNTIDGIVVIFGSPGLTNVGDTYKTIAKHIKTSKKPIYAILPSVINAKEAIQDFIKTDNIAFLDEVLFGRALAKVYKTSKPLETIESIRPINADKIRAIVDGSPSGYMSPEQVYELLKYAGINFVEQFEAFNSEQINEVANKISFPVAMKVVGPIHKSDVGGVILNVDNKQDACNCFNDLMKIDGATSVLIQPMITGKEIFVGAKSEVNFPPIVMCGLGGIYIETFKDISSCMIPVSELESKAMIENLKSYTILKGIRGQKGINLQDFSQVIQKISVLLEVVPEIVELDINPIIATPDNLFAVDARILIN